MISLVFNISTFVDMRSYVGVLLVSKIGFICHEAVTSLKLLEKGFSREDLALSVLLDFPLQIFFGYYAAKWSNGKRPLKPVSRKEKKKVYRKEEKKLKEKKISGFMHFMVVWHALD